MLDNTNYGHNKKNAINQSIIDFLERTVIFANGEISSTSISAYWNDFIGFIASIDTDGAKMVVMECVLDILHQTGLCDENHDLFYELVDSPATYSSMIMIILVTYFLDVYLYERDMKADNYGVTLNPAYAANFVYLVNSVINAEETVMYDAVRANLDIVYQDYLNGSYVDPSMSMGDFNEDGVSNSQIANFWNNLWVGMLVTNQDDPESISKETINYLFDTFLASVIYHLGLNL